MPVCLPLAQNEISEYTENTRLQFEYLTKQMPYKDEILLLSYCFLGLLCTVCHNYTPLPILKKAGHIILYVSWYVCLPKVMQPMQRLG